jgi:hypothetical protein
LLPNLPIRVALFGLSDGIIPEYKEIGEHPNSYAFVQLSFTTCCFSLAGEDHQFEFRPGMNFGYNVFGCGLLLDPNDKLAIFFTLNGSIIGQYRKSNCRINRSREST